MKMQNGFATRAWYSAGWSHELGTTPLSRRILGRQVALFRDSSGRARAIDALCPHRGADLGRGRVVGDTLACPFHGWRFDGDGRCVRVPSQPESQTIPIRACVRPYVLQEQQGILWIGMDETAPTHPPRRYDFFDPQSGFRRVTDAPRLAAAPFVCVVENAIDNSHPPFIHPKSLPGEPDVVERQRVSFDEDGGGYRGRFDTESPWRATAKGRQGWADTLRPFKRLTEKDPDRSFFRFDMGGVVYFYDYFRSGDRHVGFAAMTPADETHTWFFGELVRTYWQNPIVDAVLRRWMAWLNREDVVESEKLLVSVTPGGIANPVSVVADLPSIAFRKVYSGAVERERLALTQPTLAGAAKGRHAERLGVPVPHAGGVPLPPPAAVTQ